jgi:hypothetical protein
MVEVKTMKVQIVLDIDFALLRRQKESLVTLADRLKRRSEEKEALEALDGIINLLDSIQDQAARQEGEVHVFGEN